MSKPEPLYGDNRPIDFTVALELKLGQTLHKGQCKQGDYIYYGDHKHTRYFLTRIRLNHRKQTFCLRVVSEHTFALTDISQEEALQWHRQLDCASHKRRPPNAAPHKPNPAQQIVLPPSKSPWRVPPKKEVK